MSQQPKRPPASKDTRSPSTRGAGLRSSNSLAKPDDNPDMIDCRKKTDTYDKAAAILRSRQLIPEENHPTLDSLSGGLFLAGNATSATIREALCAFATYAKAISDNQTSTALLDKLGPALDKMSGAKRNWDDEMQEEENQRTTELEGAIGRLVVEVSKLSEGQTRLAKEMETVGRMRVELEEVVKKAATTAPAPTAQRHWGDPPEEGEIRGHDPQLSYADMARRELPREHAPTIVRQERSARQVLVDVKSRVDAEGNPLTEQELVEKANRALELMTKDPATYPEGEHFTAVSKLQQGGLLYEVSSTKMAKWLLKTDNMATFTNSFGYEAVIWE